ncbi:hypothetical protein M378DRAFT_16983 [Amanita muscaria Koide BX008]|uniref:Uncharacterized protein n=1 Tax=Amanita muscaria (strain Koide BX008) TaxID=946122 RepID=A0A0C2SRH8_AMAMK|nr:hypothetical protein M378DRAFT_16983 [Amanita muscaria Koide BX008]
MFQGVCQGRERSKRGRDSDSESATRQKKWPRNALIILSDEVPSSAGSLFSAADDEKEELAIEPKPLSLLANFLKKRPFVEITPMTPFSLQHYKKCDIEALDCLALTQSSRTQNAQWHQKKRTSRKPQKKCTTRKPKAILLGNKGVSKASSKHNSRALSQAPSWELLPACSYNEPSHNHLPEGLVKLLKHCQETSRSSSSHLCPVPGFFGFQWIDTLSCLYCEMHQCLVSGEHIWPHISRRHKGNWPKITRFDVLVGFLGHIQQCHPRIIRQSTADLKNTLPDQLPQLLPSTAVVQRYKCPVQSCTTWIAVNKGKGGGKAEYMRHIRTHSLPGAQYISASCIEPHWTQSLQIGEITRKGSSIVFIVPQELESCHSAFPIPKLTTAASPAETWATELGWDDELQRIASVLGGLKEDAVAKLRDLVELPSRDRVLRAKSDVFKFVEQGLWKLNQLNIRYFADVISWIAGKHSSFRFLFGHDRKEPFYLPVSNHELYRIRRLHCAMETMIIRSLTECTVTRKPLSFLKCSEVAQNAGYALVRLFIAEKGDPDAEELLNQKHLLFIELLKGGKRTAAKVGEVDEQALLALSLLPSGEWMKAVYVRGYVCGGLWSFRGTFANWARLQGSHYLPLDESSLQSSENESSRSKVHLPHLASNNTHPGDEVPEVPERLEEDDEDDHPAVAEDSTSIEDLEANTIQLVDSIQVQHHDLLLKISSAMMDLHFADSEEGNSSKLVAIDEFIEANRKYLQAKDAITPIGRLKLINSVLYKYATYKPPFSSTFYNGAFLMSNGRDSPVSIPLRGLRVCLLSSQQRFLAAMQAVLPTSLDLAKLPLHCVEDDFSAVSLHLQPHNQKLLEPHLATCWTGVLNGNFQGGKKLWDKWGLHRTEADKWLEACEHCFSMASAPIFLSTGGANFATLKHQQYSGPTRTVFLLKDGPGIMVFINPITSNHRCNSSLDLIAVTPELTQYLLIMFLILLPISSELRKLKGQIHPYASTHIWLMYHKRPNGGNRWLFDESHMNENLEAVTQDVFGFPINFRTLYQMAFGVLRKEFPAFFINVNQDFRSPVDDLAQHRYSTGVANYGRLTVFPKSPHLVGDQPWRHLAICQLWQAFLGCIPVKDTWKGVVENSNLFSQINLPFDLAFQTARDQVTHFYGISSLSGQQRHARVTHILQSTPYLKGITAASSESNLMGDRALSSVIKALVFGSHVPETDESPLIPAEIVADAAILVMRALCEWVDKSYIDLSKPSSNMALRFENIRKEILAKVKVMWKGSPSRSFHLFQQSLFC